MTELLIELFVNFTHIFHSIIFPFALFLFAMFAIKAPVMLMTLIFLAADEVCRILDNESKCINFSGNNNFNEDVFF